MSYANGVFTLVAGNPVVTGAVIQSSWANNTLSDIASGLSNAITLNGQSTITANINFNNQRLTNLGNATALTDAVRASQVQNWSYNLLTSVSGTNTIIASATPAPSAYAEGQLFFLNPIADATAHATLNIEGLGALPIYWNGVTATTYLIRRLVPLLLAYFSTSSQTGFHILGNSSFLPASLLTTRGDMMFASTANQIGVLAAGADGRILVASASATLGVVWTGDLALPGALNASATASFANLVVGTYGGPFPSTATASMNEVVVAGQLSASATASFANLVVSTQAGINTPRSASTATASFQNINVAGFLQSSATAVFGTLIANTINGASASAASASVISFLVVKTAAQNNIGTASTIRVTFQSAVYDSDSAFSTVSSVFVAPRGGQYFLATDVLVDSLSNAASLYQLKLITSNREYIGGWSTDALDSTAGHWTFRLATVADMDAGDVAQVALIVTGGGATPDLPSGTTASSLTFFSGFSL